jgi:serine/threonine protein kinase
MAPREPVAIVGRYAVFDEIASGGMATVHLGRLLATGGFTRTVAIKRLRPNLAGDPEFVRMFLEEARVVSHLRHANIVPTLDVVTEAGELFVVMEYVAGDSLWRLWKDRAARGERIDKRIVASILSGILHGLHAAHEAIDDRGRELNVVHRDVSPHNILVGIDGVPRLIDFGVAKVAHRPRKTGAGEIRGKFAYLSPEQVEGTTVTRTTDVFAAGITLWEALTGKRLFRAESDATTITNVWSAEVEPPSRIHADLAPYDDLVLKALSRKPEDRFATAAEMADAIANVDEMATASEVGKWVRADASAALANRSAMLAEIESQTASKDVLTLTGVFGPKKDAEPKRAADDFKTTRIRGDDADAAPATIPTPQLATTKLSAQANPHLIATVMNHERAAANDAGDSRGSLAATVIPSDPLMSTLKMETPPVAFEAETIERERRAAQATMSYEEQAAARRELAQRMRIEPARAERGAKTVPKVEIASESTTTAEDAKARLESTRVARRSLEEASKMRGVVAGLIAVGVLLAAGAIVFVTRTPSMPAAARAELPLSAQTKSAAADPSTQPAASAIAVAPASSPTPVAAATPIASTTPASSSAAIASSTPPTSTAISAPRSASAVRAHTKSNDASRATHGSTPKAKPPAGLLDTSD